MLNEDYAKNQSIHHASDRTYDWRAWALIGTVFIVFIYINVRYAIFNYDDLYMYPQYMKMIDKKGFLPSLLFAFRNMDIPNEYRTYSLLKVMSVLMYVFAGTNAKIYAFVMAGSHCASSVLLYKILSDFTKNKEASLLCAGLWLFNPFSVVQIFHHFLYIMVPAYFFLLFVWYYQKPHTKANLTALIFMALCTIFFGEGMIIPLLCFLAITMIVYFKTDNTKIKTSLTIAITVIISLVLHYLHYRFFVHTAGDHERFDLDSIFKIKNLFIRLPHIIIGDIKDSVIVFIKKWDILYVRDQLNIVFVVMLSGVMVLGYYLLKIFLLKQEKPEKIKLAKCLIIVLLALSTCAIYILQQGILIDVILYQTAYIYFPLRYTSVCVPLVFCGIIILNYSVFNKLWISRALSLSIVLILGFSASIHYFIMIPRTGELNNQIMSWVHEGERLEKKYVLFANAYPNDKISSQQNLHLRLPALLSSNENFLSTAYPMSVDTPFSMNSFSFPYIKMHSTLKPLYDIEAVSSDQDINKDEVMVIGTQDLMYFNPRERIEDLVVFYDWEDFENSTLYNGVRVYSTGRTLPKSELLRKYGFDMYAYSDVMANAVFTINSGAMNFENSQNVYSDSPFPTRIDDKKLTYGYTSGIENVLPDYGETRTNVRINNLEYIIELDEVQELSLALEFSDLWQIEPRKRMMDISIKTDGNVLESKDVDIVALGGDVAIVYNLPPTKTIELTITQSENSSDIAFVNAVRLLKE